MTPTIMREYAYYYPPAACWIAVIRYRNPDYESELVHPFWCKYARETHEIACDGDCPIEAQAVAMRLLEGLYEERKPISSAAFFHGKAHPSVLHARSEYAQSRRF